MAQELINQILIGKFDQYTLPDFNFSYMYFEWLKPWPYWGMVLHYAITIFSGWAVAFNYRYSFFSKTLFLGQTLLFLFDSTEYINHTYLYCLISFWMMFLPLDKKKTTQPAWMLYLILFHIALPYFFGGIAKLNHDWLNGTPMDLFLEARKHYPLGFLYSQEWAPYAFSYGGLFFDLLIVPIMIIPATRIFGFLISIIFHLSNVEMFGLATFPWFSMLVTSMFFNPSWPRKIPILRSCMPWGIERAEEFKPQPLVIGVVSLYVTIHLMLPLRHYLYPGNTSWTEQGHMFAWRMMLRDKAGSVLFFVQKKNTGEMTLVNARDFITTRQYNDIIGKPDLILNFAHFLRDKYEKEWNTEVAVFATSRVSLNGRPRKEMIIPGTNLAKEERSLLPYEWIQPLATESKYYARQE